MRSIDSVLNEGFSMRAFHRISACISITLLMLLMPSSVCAEDAIPITDLKAAEQVLSKADHTWLGGDATEAVPQYETLLNGLPEEAEPFRATITMRLARARLASGDTTGFLAALKRLAGMDYVPEHHALAAEELKAVAAGKPHPGQERTPIPAIGKVQAILVFD